MQWQTHPEVVEGIVDPPDAERESFVPTSVCIWDLQLTGTAGGTNWRSAVVWKRLAELAEHPSVSVDEDADGMADVWERTAFGGTNAAGGEWWEDKDHDRSSNRDEYVAGTDPTNPASVFVLRVEDAAGETFELSHPLRAVRRLDPAYGDRRRYVGVERCTNLALSAWEGAAGWTNVSVVEGSLCYTGCVTEAPAFFRGRVFLD